MEKLIKEKNNKNVTLLIISLVAIFALSIGIKAVYSNALVEIRAEYNLTNMQIRIGTLIYYIVYGLVQILLACFLKKINMNKIFFLSVILSAVGYALMMFASKPWMLWVLMGINGIFQAPHWAGCIYFVAKLLREKQVDDASNALNVSNPIGTAAAAGIVALFIALGEWRISYVVFSVLMVVFAFTFKISSSNLEKTSGVVEQVKVVSSKSQESSQTPRQKRAVLLTVVLMTLVSIFSAGGYLMINQILPTYLFDVHGVSSSLSVLLTILLPIVAMLVKMLTFKLCFRYKDYMLIMFIIDVIAVALTAPLFFVFEDYVVITLILLIFVYSLFIDVCGVLATIFPLSIKQKFNAGANGAIINAGAALGCAVIPFLSGAILDIPGMLSWKLIFLTIIGLAVLSIIILGLLMLTKKKNYTFSRED